MRIELTRREIDALKLAIGAFDNMFWNMTEDNPDYRQYELTWADLENISDTLNK